MDVFYLGIKVSRLTGALRLHDVDRSGYLSDGVVGARGQLAKVARASTEQPGHGAGGSARPGEEHPAQRAGDGELRREM